MNIFSMNSRADAASFWGPEHSHNNEYYQGVNKQKVPLLIYTEQKCFQLPFELSIADVLS